MTHESDPTWNPRLVRLVARYGEAVGRFGVGSPEATKIRQDNAENEEFQRLADAVDWMKKALTGDAEVPPRHRADTLEVK